MRHRNTWWLAGLLALLSVASAHAQFTVGEPFPDRMMPSSGGQGALAEHGAGHHATLATYRGKKIVLHVFASW